MHSFPLVEKVDKVVPAFVGLGGKSLISPIELQSSALLWGCIKLANQCKIPCFNLVHSATLSGPPKLASSHAAPCVFWYNPYHFLITELQTGLACCSKGAASELAGSSFPLFRPWRYPPVSARKSEYLKSMQKQGYDSRGCSYLSWAVSHIIIPSACLVLP